MMNKLNILQIYDYMKLGGAETHIITLSRALMDRGHNVYIAGSFGPAVNAVKGENIPFLEIDPPEENKLLENAWKIVEIIDYYNIDVIHVHPFQSQNVVALVNILRDIPVVTTIHGSYLTPSVEKLECFYNNFIFVSQESLDFHLEEGLLNKKNCYVVPNCVKIEANEISLHSKKDSLQIAYISRIDTDKLPSIVFFVECVEQLTKQMDIQVEIIGSGNQFSYLKDLIDKINRNSSKEVINLINGSDNINQHITKSDIVVGVGRVILEALALGKIPICIGNNNYVGIVNAKTLKKISNVNFTDRNTHNPYKKELFIEDINSILEKPEKVKKEIQESLKYLLNHFDIKLSAKEHERIYLEIINNHHSKTFRSNSLKYLNHIDEIESINFAFELNNQGIKYQLDTMKNNKILLKPDFYSENDNWTAVFNNLGNHFDLDNTTVVIRIDYDYLDNIDEILEKISVVFDSLDKKFDLLIDYQYHDEVNEDLFLLEMDMFIVTNNNQQKYMYKCELFGCKIYRFKNQ